MAKKSKYMKYGLVLEGGAMRGLFTAGILDVFLEEDVVFDGAVGVSAGAAFGINYASRQKGRTIRYNKRFARDWRYCSLRSWIMTGDLYGSDFAYHQLPEKYDPFDNEAFESNPMEFYLVCTDVHTGKAVYKRITKGGSNAYDWVRASASMPVVSRPVSLEGLQLLDGGIADSIPLGFFKEKGFSRNVVILTQPDGYTKKSNKLMPLMRPFLRKYPNIVTGLSQRHIMYNHQLEYVRQEEEKGEALVIRPTAPLPIGHVSHDPEEMQHIYDIGREMGQQKIKEVKEFLSEWL